jgi:protein gp37
MGETTKIQWCDHTFNPWIGCQKVAEGCRHCYAEAQMADRMRHVRWGPIAAGGTRRITSEANWEKVHKWYAAAEAERTPRRVFCASLADVFEVWSGPILDHSGKRHLVQSRRQFVAETNEQLESCSRVTLGDVREKLFRLIDATPWLDWLLLTKRPENIRRMWPGGRNRRNVWLGCSVSTEAEAIEHVPALVASADLCERLFVSAEPLLEAIDWRVVSSVFKRQIDWVIIGGESGREARPIDVADIRRTAIGAELHHSRVFVKQLGSNVRGDDGTRLVLSDSKGGDMSEWPDHLRVREFPESWDRAEIGR